VIPIHSYVEIDGQLYIDMRLVDGRDLAKLLAETGPLAPARAIDLIAQVAAALDGACWSWSQSAEREQRHGAVPRFGGLPSRVTQPIGTAAGRRLQRTH